MQSEEGDSSSSSLLLPSPLHPPLNQLTNIVQALCASMPSTSCCHDIPPLTLPTLPRRAIDQTSTSSSTLAATLCAHVGKCKQPECVASRPLPGQCMLPALTADSAFRYATPAPTATLDSNYDSYSRVRQAQRSMPNVIHRHLLLPLCLSASDSSSLSSLPLPLSSSMRLVSLAPFCYLNCRSISLSAF